jgi:hypothetical protein
MTTIPTLVASHPVLVRSRICTFLRRRRRCRPLRDVFGTTVSYVKAVLQARVGRLWYLTDYADRLCGTDSGGALHFEFIFI